MDEPTDRSIGWPVLLLVVLLLAAGFAVPLLGPLRASTARVVIAVGVLIVGAGLALLIEATGA